MTEIRIFGDHDDRTKEQMARCMQIGSVVGGVLCADGHLGYAQPVGGVITYEEHISVTTIFDRSPFRFNRRIASVTVSLQ